MLASSMVGGGGGVDWKHDKADVQVRLGPPSWMSPVQTSSLFVSRVEREGAAVARAAKKRGMVDFMVDLVDGSGIPLLLKRTIEKTRRVLLFWMIWDGESFGISEGGPVPFISSHGQVFGVGYNVLASSCFCARRMANLGGARHYVGRHISRRFVELYKVIPSIASSSLASDFQRLGVSTSGRKVFA